MSADVRHGPLNLVVAWSPRALPHACYTAGLGTAATSPDTACALSVAQIEKINMPAWRHQAESGTGGKWLLFNNESLEGSTCFRDSLFLLPDIPNPVNFLRAESGLQPPSQASIHRAASPGCPCSPTNEIHLELSIGQGWEEEEGREEKITSASSHCLSCQDLCPGFLLSWVWQRTL